MVLLNSRTAVLTMAGQQDELHPEDIDKLDVCLEATNGSGR